MSLQQMTLLRREVLTIWRDRSLRYILLFGALIAVLLFLAIYSAQVIKAIPTAIVDLDHSNTSLELTSYIRNTENLQVIAYPQSFEDLEDLIRQGGVVTGIVIPENYGRDIALGRQTRLLAIIDGSNMIYATNASSAILTIARTIAAEAGIKTLVGHGVQYSDAQAAYQTIDFQEEPWYNPALNYAYFLVLALALNIWQQCCILSACMTVAGETGRASWLQIRAAGFSRLRLFACKAVVQVVAFMLVALPVYLLAGMVFSIPMRCGFLTLLLFTALFAVSLQSVGTLMSSLARNAVDASRFGMIIALPSFVLSGYTWPLEAMPRWLQLLARVFPQTWFFQGLNYLTFKNPGWDFMSRYFLALLAIACVCYSVAAVAISHNSYRVRRAGS
jgi:ABC-2 type transport system permease protein